MLTESADASPYRAQIEQDVGEILTAALPWRELAGKTILITGATGFIGAYFVETLAELNRRMPGKAITIILHVRSAEKARRRFAQTFGFSDFEIIEGDVGNSVDIDRPIDVIFHAASPASPRHYLADPVGVLRANLNGTQWLLELATRNNARLLLFSSGEVYGQTNIIPTPEDGYGYLDPASVRACYGEGKRAAETLCVAWSHQLGTNVSMVRPFHTYGPGIALDDGRVFADFVADVIGGRNIVMHSDGSATRAFCYISDAMRGFFAVLFEGKPATAYNVGNPAGETSIAALAELLVSLYPDKGLKVVRNPLRRDPSYAQSPISRNVPDITRIQALGWAPVISLREGFRKMIGSYGQA